MSANNRLLRSLSAAQFSLWELHLYLNTHPNDMTALSMYHKYEEKFNRLKKEYEEIYGPLSQDSAEGIEWIKNPWPWDRQEEN